MSTPIIYDNMVDLYDSLSKELKENGTPLKHLTELFGVNRILKIPYNRIGEVIRAFQDTLPNYPWDQRQSMETLHYNKLRYSLSHSFAENWFYKTEWITQTRRVVALSSDCISSISLYIRDDNKMHLCVYFRSSHITSLLPVDFRFLVELPMLFMGDLSHVVRTFDIPHVLPEVEEINLNLFFGNLHG